MPFVSRLLYHLLPVEDTVHQSVLRLKRHDVTGGIQKAHDIDRDHDHAGRGRGVVKKLTRDVPAQNVRKHGSRQYKKERMIIKCTRKIKARGAEHRARHPAARARDARHETDGTAERIVQDDCKQKECRDNRKLSVSSIVYFMPVFHDLIIETVVNDVKTIESKEPYRRNKVAIQQARS